MVLILEELVSSVDAQVQVGVCFASDLYVTVQICPSPCAQQRAAMIDMRCCCSAKCRFVVILVVALFWQVHS